MNLLNFIDSLFFDCGNRGWCGPIGGVWCVMEELKRQLCLKTLKPLGGASSGGCISNGQSYQTDTGRIFVKSNDKKEVSGMGGGGWVNLSFLYSGCRL